MFCVPASESQLQPGQTSTNLNIHHVPVIHRPAVGRRNTHGQNLPILIDTERPQFDGVRMKARTREWWKVGSFWHHLLTGERKAAWVQDRAMLLALDPRVMCGERQKAWPTASTCSTSPASTLLREHPSPSPADTPFIPTFICYVPNQLHE